MIVFDGGRINITNRHNNISLFFQSCWVERVEASRYLDSGDSGMYLKRPVGWWIGPPKRRVAWGVRYAASGGIALLLLLGLLANFTVIGSVEPFGIVPFSSWIARSASTRWSNLMKPTPFDKPVRSRAGDRIHRAWVLISMLCLMRYLWGYDFLLLSLLNFVLFYREAQWPGTF